MLVGGDPEQQREREPSLWKHQAVSNHNWLSKRPAQLRPARFRGLMWFIQTSCSVWMSNSPAAAASSALVFAHPLGPAWSEPHLHRANNNHTTGHDLVSAEHHFSVSTCFRLCLGLRQGASGLARHRGRSHNQAVCAATQKGFGCCGSRGRR